MKVNKPNMYDTIMDYLKSSKYERTQMCLDEMSKIVTLKSLCKNCTGDVISIRCPSRHVMTLCGINQLNNDEDIRNVHSIRVKFTDSNNNELSPDTRIRIVKEKISSAMTNIDKILYKDISTTNFQKELPHKCKLDTELYNLSEGLWMEAEDVLKFYIINSDKEIDCKNTRIVMNIDLWEDTKL